MLSTLYSVEGLSVRVNDVGKLCLPRHQMLSTLYSIEGLSVRVNDVGKLCLPRHQMLSTLYSIEGLSVRVNDVHEVSVRLVQPHGSGVVLEERLRRVQSFALIIKTWSKASASSQRLGLKHWAA